MPCRQVVIVPPIYITPPLPSHDTVVCSKNLSLTTGYKDNSLPFVNFLNKRRTKLFP